MNVSLGSLWYTTRKTPDLSSLDQLSELISELAEMIIPKTDTAGAKEAGVGEFIIMMIKECTDRSSQNKFLSGLQDLENYCQLHFDNSFLNCYPHQRHRALKSGEEDATLLPGILGKAQQKFLGKAFFTTLKEYTVTGYCTSMLGATQALTYDYIPGSYQGCITCSENQKSWATR